MLRRSAGRWASLAGAGLRRALRRPARHRRQAVRHRRAVAPAAGRGPYRRDRRPSSAMTRPGRACLGPGRKRHTRRARDHATPGTADPSCGQSASVTNPVAQQSRRRPVRRLRRRPGPARATAQGARGRVFTPTSAGSSARPRAHANRAATGRAPSSPPASDRRGRRRRAFLGGQGRRCSQTRSSPEPIHRPGRADRPRSAGGCGCDAARSAPATRNRSGRASRSRDGRRSGPPAPGA